ncbi:MAG: hypothetical protein PSX80_07990 [bacterium]|nr:hypothetical protein [bacterium]
MRKISACDFMTLDGVIQNEENGGDGFNGVDRSSHMPTMSPEPSAKRG